MKENYNLLTYQHYLRAEFEGRKLRNPSYSLRAYARDIGLAAPKLSEILRGKCGLSEESAKKLATELALSEKEASVFINQVIAKHSRKKTEREKAQKILESLKEHHSFDEIALDAFKIIADWYHFAILELTEVEDFRSNISWIAKRLNLTKSVTSEAVERLFDTGLLAKKSNGDWYQTEAILATPSGIPSSEIKKHHRQILSKAEDALINVPIKERDFSTTTLAVSESQLDEIQKEIKDFRRRLAKKINQSKNKERVYCLSIQFFPLDYKGYDI
ncbi:MAG: hypothetical protein A2381_14760 [Bdellovibrionales bacterium RIFOXYB1_FULL_37_110]|nr:MAG: hypothetical protein A2417_10265 [Bdellovibrionales bacterium RIFOXYC1_FULL_37_79]OFZ60126.1 MAG: hypothetical protein A2381_14760 [Bdellovibrionales bacterium RIFOXYB1_FULL_37_110]OFZ64380.1 MAG: hypothetical protein A2577_10010 [Bdellovibrionales bacterium RIFOXYD1_FULL_36_51]